MRDIADLIKYNDTIIELNLNDNNISTNGLLILCSALATNKSIKNLNIENNQFPRSALKSLLNLLYYNNTLLDIKYTCPLEKHDHDYIDKDIIDEIEQNSVLEPEDIEIDLPWNSMDVTKEKELKRLRKSLTKKKKCCWWCPIMFIWYSFMADKKEAFKFKYDTDSISKIESK